MLHAYEYKLRTKAMRLPIRSLLKERQVKRFHVAILDNHSQEGMTILTMLQ